MTPTAPAPDSHGGPAEDRPLTPEERAEYDRLRKSAAVRHRRLRYTGASLLLLLALLLSPVAVVSAWLANTISDQDRYVQTVAPLADDAAVQGAVTDRLTNRVVSNVDVGAITDALQRALQQADAPPVVVDRAEALEGPLKGALTSAVRSVVSKVVTSDQFETVWTEANRRAQAAVVKVLTGEGAGAVQASGDMIVLDLGTLTDELKARLVDAGFEKASVIPEVDKQIPLLQVEKLNQAQDAMRLLNVLGAWLPVAVLVLAALAVWAAPAHRVWLLATAVGLFVMMLLLLVALAVARRIYLDSVPPAALPPDAAAAVYDTLVRFLRQSARTLLVLSVVTALAAYLYGPGRGARGVRRTATRATGAAGRSLERLGMRTGSTGRWLDGHRAWTTGVVIGAGALALLLWNYPTPGVVALVLGVVVLVLVVLGVLAAAPGDTARAGRRPTRTG
ncbi:hypothetical protein [Streptomyces antimicrobicus]|uniref:Integral membrane protein n=1 Tax=Streptomyces antimicrobicus TaxID=2883108 RepID=A0ABS8B498_9ACTN|nr:hypothetical protein [Streptomyces antimicrobicus]MCB5179416.1 hypothetical protein [Streptomyces antimicrobicus]